MGGVEPAFNGSAPPPPPALLQSQDVTAAAFAVASNSNCCLMHAMKNSTGVQCVKVRINRNINRQKKHQHNYSVAGKHVDETVCRICSSHARDALCK
jgi:hypothetical protein